MSSLGVTFPSPVLVLEDDHAMQQRLQRILYGLGYAANLLLFADTLSCALKLLTQHTIPMAIVDLGLPDGHGQTFIEALHKKNPNSLILVISAWKTQDAILNTIEAGATGYILKERDDLELAISIRNTLQGGTPIDPFIAKQILRKFIPLHKIAMPTKSDTRSKRELEILELITKGLSHPLTHN